MGVRRFGKSALVAVRLRIRRNTGHKSLSSTDILRVIQRRVATAPSVEPDKVLPTAGSDEISVFARKFALNSFHLFRAKFCINTRTGAKGV